MTIKFEKLTALERILLEAGLVDAVDSFMEDDFVRPDPVVTKQQIVAAAEFARRKGVAWQRELLQLFYMLVSNESDEDMRDAMGGDVEGIEPLVDLVMELTVKAAAAEQADQGFGFGSLN